VFAKFIGDKAFYRKLLMMMLPIMVQNGITNFVNMLDNVMIGAVGTAPMTGVSLANQLLFVFNLCIFGAVSGAGIFGTQFFGSGDMEGARYSFRFKLLFCGLVSALGIGLFLFWGEDLLLLYMQGEEGLTDAAATLAHGKDYLLIMLLGLIPYTLVQCYASTMRESGNPVAPMLAGMIAVFVNLFFNYVLIFGKLGFPELGVNGAAIATVLSRFVELAVVLLWGHRSEKFAFLRGAYRSLYIPKKLVGQFFIKGLPLMVNESLWATGVATVNQCYSVFGLDAMAAVNISQTFWNVFSIVFMSVGAAIGILLGQMLGANQLTEAKDASYKMIAFSFLLAIGVGAIYLVLAEFIPLAYNTEPEIRLLATRLMQITALAMPLDALTNAGYFTLRSGGRMLITFLFDSCFILGVNVPLAYCLGHFSGLPFLAVFALMPLATLIKATASLILIRKGIWVRNIIS